MPDDASGKQVWRRYAIHGTQWHSAVAVRPVEFRFLQLSLNQHNLRIHVSNTLPAAREPDATPLCKLSEVQAGVSVTIKQLSASPELSSRLRELGFCEEQRIKLLSRNPNLICQVCNARLGLSSRLAGLIWVEKSKPQRLAA